MRSEFTPPCIVTFPMRGGNVLYSRIYRSVVKRLVSPIGIAAGYVVSSVLWQLFSDPLLKDYIYHPTYVRAVRSIWILFSAVVLFVVVRQHHALRDSRHEYKLLVDHLREPIIVHSGGVIIDANKEAVELLQGDSLQDLLGKPILDFVTPEFQSVARRRIETLNNGVGTEPIEEQFMTLKGEIRDVEVVGLPVQFHGKPGIQIIVRNMTNRKKAEGELKKVVSLFRVIEENMTDVISLIDVHGNIIYTSQSQDRLLGRPPAVSSGQFSPENIHPEDLPLVLEKIQTKTRFRVEFRIKHGSGQWMTIELTGTPVVDDNHQTTHLILVTRDITETKESEELLRRSDKLAVVGQLAAGVAHEIRNPLTSLMGFTQLLSGQTDKDKQYLQIMRNELTRIEMITNEMLLLAKPQDTKYLPKMLAPIVEEVITLIHPRAILNNVDVAVNLGPNHPLVECDENQLKQVFINVTKNAIEAMPAGGSLTVTMHVDEDVVSLSFTDNGAGIPEDHIHKIGQPFYTTKERGTGLGLMVSQKIIQDHKGEFRIRSQVGEGTTVRITLPLVPSSDGPDIHSTHTRSFQHQHSELPI